MHNLIRFCMIRKWFAFFGIPVACLLHAAAGEPGYNDAKWAFLDTPTVLKAAGEITLAKYPDSDDAIVEKKMIRLYRADGTGESQDEAFVKVLTEKGKRGNRSLGATHRGSVRAVHAGRKRPAGRRVRAVQAAQPVRRAGGLLPQGMAKRFASDALGGWLVSDVPGVFVYHATPLQLIKPWVKGAALDADKYGNKSLHWPGYSSATTAMNGFYMTKDVSKRKS